MSHKASTRENRVINHIALVLDASYSMNGLSSTVIKAADEQIAYLARRSQELSQETRVSVYTFADDSRNEIFDMDVLRLPSISELYRTRGNTALLDSIIQSQADLEQTAQMYDDHSFFTIVLTDGQENASSRGSRERVTNLIARMKDNWTLALLVPDQHAKREVIGLGIPKDNVAVWDATSASGMAEAAVIIREATDAFMTGRSQGIRGTRSVFSTGVDAVNSQTIAAAKLTPVDPFRVRVFDVDTSHAVQIRPFLEDKARRTYVTGAGFYQLTKTEKIQAHKKIMIRRIKDGEIFEGASARSLLGLPNMEVTVRPQHNPEFEIFVQSTSVNRNLIPGQKVIYRLPDGSKWDR